MSTERWLTEHAADLRPGLAGLHADAAIVESWGQRLAQWLGTGGRLLVAGNGGSAAEAQHLTSELVGRYVEERRPMSAIALNAESSSLTAILNDYGVEEVFARQVRAHGQPGDVLLLLSTSGASANILRAAERGREHGLRVWAMTGACPNPLSRLAHETLEVRAGSTAAVQEVHLVAVHALCAAIDAALPPAAAPGVERAAADPAAAEPATADPAAEPAAAEAAAARAERTVAPTAARDGASAAIGPRVVVVGDVLLDRDLFGHIERIAPDAPVPVVDLEAVRESPGGAGLTALLCAASGVSVTLVAPIAVDDAGTRLRARLSDEVELVALPHTGETRSKTRVRSAGQSLLRLDDGGPGAPFDVPVKSVRDALRSADVVLVSDYGAGTTSNPALRELLSEAALRCTVVWDPHPRGAAPVDGVALVTPNLAEARSAAGLLGLSASAPPDVLAESLRAGWRSRGVCVTAGSHGAYLAPAASEPMFVPAPAVSGGDPCGAGDRFSASAAVALARGAVLSEAVQHAVADASAWVAAGGAEGFRRRNDDSSPRPGGKRDATLDEVVARVRASGGTLVATGGCFDILHAGHVACLDAARRLGDALVVLVNSDESVRRLKGPGRPSVAAEDRMQVLGALASVDAVALFTEDDPRAALDRLRPDVWVKGGDYDTALMPEADLVRSWGGRIVLLPYVDGRSTSSILDRAALTSAAEEAR